MDLEDADGIAAGGSLRGLPRYALGVMIPTITEDQRAAMTEQGFFVLPGVFSLDEMDDLADAVQAFQERHEAALLANGGASGISRAGEITFTDHLAEQDERIMAFVKRPEFVKITTEFLGPDVDLYWNQTVFKQPEGAREFPWHQDDGYTAVDPSPYLTLWLAINDATEENGCISAMPGSHKNGLVEHFGSPLGFVCHSNDDPNQGVLVPVDAGGMAVFWSLTMHKSGPNRSTGIRKAYVIQYCKAGLRRVDTGEIIPDLVPVARNGQLA